MTCSVGGFLPPWNMWRVLTSAISEQDGLKDKAVMPKLEPKVSFLDLEFSTFAGEISKRLLIQEPASWKPERPLRLVKLDRVIYALLALFQFHANFQVVFLSQRVPLFSTFLLLSSQRLPCLILGGENERTWRRPWSTSGSPLAHHGDPGASRAPHSGCMESLVLRSALPADTTWRRSLY